MSRTALAVLLLLGLSSADALVQRSSAVAQGGAARVAELESEVESLRAELAAFEAEEGEPAKKSWIWPSSSQKGGENSWDADAGAGSVAWVLAFVFVCLIGSVPLFIHWCGEGEVTKSYIVETAILYVWLIGGLWLFCTKITFASPHFKEPRPLNLEEAVYLFSQILTTVGYGDIVPADGEGRMYVGTFVFLSILLIANMVSELVNVVSAKMEGALLSDASGGDEADDDSEEAQAAKVSAAFQPVKIALAVYGGFVVLGMTFFHLFPGEGKTWGQGLYMSVITLSTVGFGAVTPVTRGGMVFGAFWMLFGVAALGSCVTAFGTFQACVKESEAKREERRSKSPR